MQPGANLPGCILFLSSNQSFCTICSLDPRCENQKEIVLELKQLRATIQTVGPDIVEESSKGVSCQSCSPGQKKLVVRVLGLAAEAKGGFLAVNDVKKWVWLGFTRLTANRARFIAQVDFGFHTACHETMGDQ